MPSHQEILARAVGSRYGSSAAPWESYAGTSPSSLDIPTGGFSASDFAPPAPGGQGQMESEWRQLLNIIDPEGEGLRTAQARYGTLSDQAAAVGINPEGEEEGLLTAAAKLLDIPRAAVFSAGKELSDLVGGGGNGASWDDLRQQFNLRVSDEPLPEGLARGFGDTEVLQYDEDDSWLERGAKATGAFAGDVLADPLTYVTFGAGSLGKKAMAGMVKSTVAQRAVADLPQEALETFTQRTLRGRAASSLSSQTDDLPEDLSKALDELKIGGGPAVGAEHVASQAAERYLVEGATGMRKFLEDEFGEAGKKLFNSLPSDVRGGMRIRVPFAYDQGVRRTVNLAGGGGRFPEAIGLDRATLAARKAFNKVRASRAAQTLSATFGGAHGDLYGKMLADIIQKDPDDLQRISYHMYDSVVQATKKARKSADEMSELSRRTIGMAHHYLDSADDVDGAKAAFARFFQNPEEVRRLVDDTGLEVDEAGRFHVSSATLDMPDSEVRGLAAATLFQDTLRDLATRARTAGVPLGELSDYVPRALTNQAREQRVLAKAGRAPKRGRGGGTYDASKSREFFREPEFVEEGGEVTLRWRDLTPEEANARVREAGGDSVDDLFETDPFQTMAKYTDGLASVVYRTNFARLLVDSGEVVKAGTKVKSAYSANKLRKVLDKADLTLDDMAQIDGLADEALASREALQAAVASLAEAPTMQAKMEHVATISKALQTASRRVQGKLSAAAPADAKRIEKARRQLARQADQAKRAKVRSQEVDDLGAALSPLGVAPREGAAGIEGLGLEKLGSGGERPLRALPPELDETYAPEAFRAAAEKFYAASTGQSSVQDWIDRVYRPYLSMFKTQATIGRGPGFHVRNLVGGFWNNFLIDVTAADHKLSAVIQTARVRAGHEARKQTAQELADIRHIPLGQAKKQVSAEVVQARAEQLLREDLSKVKFHGDMTAYDVHRASVDQEVGWRQGEQSELSEQQRRANASGTSPEERARQSWAPVLFTDDDPSRMQRAANSMVAGKHPLGWWVRANGSVAQRTESFLRDAAYIQGLRRYGFDDGGEMAAMLPKASQFDYQDLSEFESKWLRGFALPFYTWNRNNVPLQFRALLTNPGKINRLMHAAGAARDAFGAEDQEMVPEWMRDRLGFVTNWEFDGNPLVLGVESPATALNDFFKVDSPVDAAQALGGELISQASPVIQGPLEYATGRDFFTGADLGELSGTDAPLWYRALGLTKAVPTWDEDGDVQGDARIINAVETAAPWLNQAQKLAGMAGAGTDEAKGRAPSEAIRQLFPVVASATLTPDQEEGMLYSRMDRISDTLERVPAAELETVRLLLEMGLSPDDIRSILEQKA